VLHATVDQALRQRIELTVSGRDCDGIPKVPGAGEVVDGMQIMHNGVLVVAGGYFGEWMQEIIERLHGHHEPQEERVFHEVVERLAGEPSERPRVIIELGAFWSYYSLWFLRRLAHSRAILVEPDPVHLEVGRRNVAANGVDERVTVVAAAVGERPEPPAPFLCEGDAVTRPVPTESLETIFAAGRVDVADVVLFDIQGAELAALRGARRLIEAGRVRFAAVSTHHQSISGDPLTHQRCLQFLREVGGHIVAEHTVAESFSGDGLIVASFDARDRDLRVELACARACDSLFGDPQVDLAAVVVDRDVARRELRDALVELDASRRTVAGLLGSRTFRYTAPARRTFSSSRAWLARRGRAPQDR
jgi:FkbM family methyltransferase